VVIASRGCQLDKSASFEVTEPVKAEYPNWARTALPALVPPTGTPRAASVSIPAATGVPA
jgi:hypothetical protein